MDIFVCVCIYIACVFFIQYAILQNVDFDDDEDEFNEVDGGGGDGIHLLLALNSHVSFDFSIGLVTFVK